MKITNTSVKNLPHPESGYQIAWDESLPGFGVRVTSTGYKSFVVEARVHGKTRRTTLGKFGVLTAEQARKKAKAVMGRMSEGADPTAEKRQRRAESVTLAEVAEDYKTKRRTSAGLPLKESTKNDIDKHLKSTLADWRDTPVTSITREMVQRRYAERCKRSVAQANQGMRVLRALLNYTAAAYRMPDGSPVIRDNPVSVLRDANMLRSIKPRSSMVPLDELGKWWSAVQDMRSNLAQATASQSAADLVALLALTGLRIGEARAMRWEQLDLGGASLKLTDTKNRTDITLPLSSLAVEILEARANSTEWVFPARSGAGHLMDCRGQLEALGGTTGVKVTAHDLRRTFRAVTAKCGIELWRCKALMNHKQSQDVTLHSYTDLTDVRYLKPEADQIAEHYEDQRRIHEAVNVVTLERRA